MEDSHLPDAAASAGATRRRVLGTLALAPLLPLAAGCATARPVTGERPATGDASTAGVAPSAAPADEASSDPYRVLRVQPLTGDPEPALSFHAIAPQGARR